MQKPNPYHHRIRLQVFSLLLILTLLLSGIPNGLAASIDPPRQSFEAVPIPAQALNVTSESVSEKQPVTLPGLDSTLADLVTANNASPQAVSDLARQRGLQISASQVYVQFVIDAGNQERARTAILQSGGKITGVSNDGDLMQGWLPIDSLESLAAGADVRLIRRPAEPVLLDLPAAPTATTEALGVLNAPAWHAAGFTGSGVKVGIIDAGFLGYTGLLGSELPSTVVVKNFVDGESPSNVDGTSNHGTACTEIVHDIAPGAALYLAKIATNIDLQEAVAWLKDTHHVDVISTSLGWFNQTPGDGTGEFADLVQQARNAGILWVTAAGNSRDEHWGGPFYDSDGDGVLNFPSGDEINFFGPGGGYVYMIPSGYTIEAFLRWDDWINVNQDYSLTLWKWNGKTTPQIVAMSNDSQNGAPGQTPTEDITYVTSGYSSAAYGFTINRVNSNRNVNFEFFAINITSLNDYLYSRSLVNLADAPGAVTVGALDVNSPYPQEYYSSEGPTNGPGGTATGGSIKPNISGYTNVTTQSYAGFNGTSAATPHVSGAAALVAGAYPSYTPSQIQAYLQDNAIDMGIPGMDNVYGSGRLFLGNPPTPPQLQALPDQVLPLNGSSNPAIDLWAYASDINSPDDQLVFTIENTPDTGAGVSIDSNNRYVNINPASGWQGQTSVTIRVTDPQNMFATDTFDVFAGILWNGSASADWHTPANWTPNSVPTVNDDALILNAPNWPALNSSAAAVNNLRLFPGTTLEMTNPNLTVEGVLTNYGTISQTQVVTEGLTTRFVHVTNLLGTETKYNGLDISPTGNPPLLPEGASAPLEPNVAFTTTVSVAISGNQTCPNRILGVARCYQVTPAAPLNASIQFYFTDTERRWYSLGDLVAFRYDGGWIEEPGTYVSGGSGDAEYILSPSFSSFSLFSVAKSGEVEAIVLPLIFKN
jgi:subtilisin family serine protease